MSKTDSLLKKAAFYEKLAIYGGRQDFLKAIAQVTPMVGGTPEAEAYINQFPKPTPAKKEPVRINTSIQSMLNNVLVPLGKIMPLQIDGELGDFTKKALVEFRKTFGVEPTLVNLQDARTGKIKPLDSGPVDLEPAAKRQDFLAHHPEEVSGLKL